MPALPSSLIEPIWEQVAALLPERRDRHPLGCHRPRICDRTVFELLINVLVFGAGYRRHADRRCSATTLRRRRDEWIAAGVMGRLEAAAREGYDRLRFNGPHRFGLVCLLGQSRCQVPVVCHLQRLDNGPNRLLLADETLSALGDGLRHQAPADRA